MSEATESKVDRVIRRLVTAERELSEERAKVAELQSENADLRARLKVVEDRGRV